MVYNGTQLDPALSKSIANDERPFEVVDKVSNGLDSACLADGVEGLASAFRLLPHN